MKILSHVTFKNYKEKWKGQKILWINPSKAIENQERRGQQSVVRNQRLPKKLNDMSVPREVRWNGVEDSMEWEERKQITVLTVVRN